MMFKDRVDAGRRLGRRLRLLRTENPIVLALPRGGVVVGREVADILGAPLDVVVVRKIGAPMQPELAVGAIAEGGARWINGEIQAGLGLSDPEIEERVVAEEGELEVRKRLFRGGRPLPDFSGRTAILVDDGLATGATARAAIRAIRSKSPRRVVLAVPVGAPSSIEEMREEVDQIVCLETPQDLFAIGMWFRDFKQVTDAQVVELLDRSRGSKQADPGGP